VFRKLGMIELDHEQTIWILNWSKYQNTAGLARIREVSLMQLESRCPNKSNRTRELGAARQRKHREKQKQQAASGSVTRHALRGVTECVTQSPQTSDSERGTVTLQNKNKIKIKELPPSVPQRGTGTNEHREFSIKELQQWMNSLFDRQRQWSY